jgi:hypothetical protein
MEKIKKKTDYLLKAKAKEKVKNFLRGSLV